MSSYVALTIADSHLRLVVAHHYIGGNSTVDRIREVLHRAADHDHTEIGFESWGEVGPDEVRAILTHAYVDGLVPELLSEWERLYPPGRYLWCLTRDY
jgi:hypothetical protein